MAYVQFNKVLDELDGILSHNQKRAEAIADENVLGGNRKATDGQGADIPDSLESEDAVDVLYPEPSKTDPNKKSVKYQINSDSADTKVVDETLKTEAEKSAKIGNAVLKDLYRLLGKKGEMDEEEVEESAENIEESADDISDEAAEIVEEADVEAEITPEDEEVLAALGAKTAEDRAVYLLSKQAGMNFANEFVKSGMMASPEGMQKQAAYMAGSMIADMEARGLVCSAQQMEKVGFILGELIDSSQNATLEKTGAQMSDIIKATQEQLGAKFGQIIKVAREEAFKQGAEYGVKKLVGQHQERQGIVKEAAAVTTENIIHELTKRQLSQGRNLPVNP